MSWFVVLVSCSCHAINRVRAVPNRALVLYRASCLKPLSKSGPPTYRAVFKPVNYRIVPLKIVSCFVPAYQARPVLTSLQTQHGYQKTQLRLESHENKYKELLSSFNQLLSYEMHLSRHYIQWRIKHHNLISSLKEIILK